MIHDIELCSPVELSEQISYLEGTPVAGIAALLRRGTLRLYKGTVRSVRELGTLKTEFGKIGSQVAPPMDGESKFRICEVLPLLRTHPNLDQQLMRNIQEFIDKDARGEVAYNTTILRRGTDLIVKDGNKRTVALYERRNDGPDRISFSVFLAV